MRKLRLGDRQKAATGDISLEVAADIRTYQSFLDERRRLYVQLFGRDLKESWLRERLTREIAIACAEGRRMTLADYQRLMGRAAGRSTVTSEIRVLEASGLVVLEPNGRTYTVTATKRLAAFYQLEMKRLRQQIEDVLAADPLASGSDGPRSITL